MDPNPFKINTPPTDEEQKEPGVEEKLAQLDEQSAVADAEDKTIIASLTKQYGLLLVGLPSKDPLRERILAAKKFLQERARKAVQPENTAPKQIILDERIKDQKIIPVKDKEAFLVCFAKLPPQFQAKYSERLTTVLKARDEASVVTALRGATFEMSRIITLIEQGLETVDLAQVPKKITLNYLGYDKSDAPDTTVGPTREVKDAGIELDVPMMRDGMPYVYETKSYPRKQYGIDSQAKNQLLKYQAAIDQGLVSGVTVEVRGRLDHQFLDWAIGAKLDDPGNAPSVEIIYTVDLPSGKEYRFVLKRSKDRSGLTFKNPANYDANDHLAIAGIQQSLADKSIIGLMTETAVKPEEASDALRPLLNSPAEINTRELFDEYDNLRTKALAEALLAKRVIINKENKKSSVSEYATPEYIERIIREYLDYLAQNPEFAKVKAAYVIPQENIQVAIEQTIATLMKIAEYEKARVVAPESAGAVATRILMGYRGRPEGVALDIEHIMLDTLYSLNKDGIEAEMATKALDKQSIALFLVPSSANPSKYAVSYKSFAQFQEALALPENDKLRLAYEKMSRRQKDALLKLYKEAEFVRSYTWPERFSTVEKIPEMLKGQDRRYMELQIFDPVDGTVFRQTDTTEDKIDDAKNTMLKENIERARKRIAGTKHESANKHPIAALEKKLKTMEVERDERIKIAQKEAAKNIKTMGSAAFDGVKKISLEYREKTREFYEQLEALYQQVIPKEEWRGLAKRVTKVLDQNIVKFIYATTAEGEVIVQEEVLRGDVSGRAAHSELAQGRNTYGAGELAFTKINDQWVLTEINNGSGHYRPDAETTLAYVRNLVQSKGIDVSRAELTDSILRGLALKDASAF